MVLRKVLPKELKFLLLRELCKNLEREICQKFSWITIQPHNFCVNECDLGSSIFSQQNT